MLLTALRLWVLSPHQVGVDISVTVLTVLTDTDLELFR